MGIQLYDAMLGQGLLQEVDADPHLTLAGRAFTQEFGIDVAALDSAKAPLCKACLDWSARRTHLAGSLGRAFLSEFESRGWAQRDRSTRVVTFTRAGEAAFHAIFPA
jgi:hypothetical protein